MPASDDVTVSVLVVNYNGARHLERFFASLASAFEQHRHEVIVVDNASTDGSAEWLRARAGIVLVEPGCNTGFAEGNNIAAAQARGRVLLLLNNDTELHGGLDALADAALAPGVGAVGCRLQYGDARLQHSMGLAHTPARIVLSWLGLERRAGLPALFRKVEVDAARYARPQRDVAWVSGACLATRREVWQLLGGLDAALFMYCEDVDYCERARRAGWRVDYLAAPTVTHFEGGGKAWVGTAALLRTARAYHLYLAKHHGAATARACSAALALLFGARAAAFALLGRLPGTQRPRAVQRDKASGFLRATHSMARAAWSGRAPPLP